MPIGSCCCPSTNIQHTCDKNSGFQGISRVYRNVPWVLGLHLPGKLAQMGLQLLTQSLIKCPKQLVYEMRNVFPTQIYRNRNKHCNGEEDEAQDAVGARKIHANRAAISNTCWMCANIYTDCSTYRYISLSLSLPLFVSL